MIILVIQYIEKNKEHGAVTLAALLELATVSLLYLY